MLLFDQSTQQATLEPLSSSYTFNLTTKNNKDISSQHAKIYPKKTKDDVPGQDGHDDLFGEEAGDDESGDPDPDNPYDFRHFLAKDKEKRGDDSDYPGASSPDCRAGTGSAANTPQFGARKPAAATVAKPKAAEPAAKKRRTVEADPFMKKKPGPKKAQPPPPPSIQLERRASERPAPETAPKSRSKPAGPPASKIKSSELVHSSDDSDMDADAEAEPEHVASPPRHARRSPSPQRVQNLDIEEEEEDAEADSDGDGGLEIEVPDARPSRPRNTGALASLGLGQSLGAGGGFKSPSTGPISLASATSSVQGSPNPHNFTPRKNRAQDNSVIDFGDLGGDDDAEGEEDEEDEVEVDVEDGNPDVDDFDIGPPARQSTGHDRKASMGASGPAGEEDEDDPLYEEMMKGLIDGDSSSESEEE